MFGGSSGWNQGVSQAAISSEAHVLFQAHCIRDSRIDIRLEDQFEKKQEQRSSLVMKQEFQKQEFQQQEQCG